MAPFIEAIFHFSIANKQSPTVCENGHSEPKMRQFLVAIQPFYLQYFFL